MKRVDKAPSRVTDFLKELVEIAGSVDFALRRPHMCLRWGTGAEVVYKERNIRSRAVSRLKQRQLIAVRPSKEGWRVRLTKTGAEVYLQRKILDAEMMDDDTICLVMFDIPERQKKLRREIGNFLLNAGFIRLQRSVYISPFDAFQPLREWLKLRKLEGCSVVYRAYDFPDVVLSDKS
ncbi:MAG: CRISPR-associated endonuclease Cas2 [Candidatus Uhrbacteria bacterium]|nr:CRISPR-associated endonuclease Cas2 [Candidatus Uhrbacteria bacterium]